MRHLRLFPQQIFAGHPASSPIALSALLATCMQRKNVALHVLTTLETALPQLRYDFLTALEDADRTRLGRLACAIRKSATSTQAHTLAAAAAYVQDLCEQLLEPLTHVGEPALALVDEITRCLLAIPGSREELLHYRVAA